MKKRKRIASNCGWLRQQNLLTKTPSELWPSNGVRSQLN